MKNLKPDANELVGAVLMLPRQDQKAHERRGQSGTQSTYACYSSYVKPV